MILKRIKRHRPLMVPLIIFLHLILGATVPPYHCRPVSQITEENAPVTDLYQDGSGCDRTVILETNQSVWDERICLMGMVKERIILPTFDFRNGESPRDIMSLMLHKADKGVRAQIPADGLSGLMHMERNNYFYTLSNHSNTEIKIYNKTDPFQSWTAQGRIYDKYVAADDYGCMLGGRNIFSYFIGPYPTDSHSHDRKVLMCNMAHGTEGSAKSSLYQVEEYSNQIWDLEVSSLFHDSETLGEKAFAKNAAAVLRERYDSLASAHSELFVLDNEDDLATLERPDLLAYYQTHTMSVGKITPVSSLTTIYAKEPAVLYTLAQLVKRVKECAVIHTPHAVFNNIMYETMLEVTEQVLVTMMANSAENRDNFFVSNDCLLHKKKFINTDMEVLKYGGGFSYHGKSLAIGDELYVIGPYNLNLCSTCMDIELMLAVQSPSLTAQLKEHMDSCQQDCRTPQSDGIHKIPVHVNVVSVPLYRRTA